MSTIQRLARERALKKRRREKRLAQAYAKHDREREKNPLPQPQLELDDVYYSKREHEQRVLRQYIEQVLP